MGRIIVGIDGSDAARHALGWALDDARLRQATVEVVHAWDQPFVGHYPYVEGMLDAETHEKAARHLLDATVDEADTTGLAGPVERVLVRGSAASAIVHRGRSADLVVVGSRGLGGFTGLLLGSVSQQVTHHAPCPVTVVPLPD